MQNNHICLFIVLFINYAILLIVPNVILFVLGVAITFVVELYCLPDVLRSVLVFCLLAGMGFNMVTLSSFVVVQQYFGKHRALAAGISAAGISVGTLSGGPIIGSLAVALGWRGALLILSGITLNCTLLGCFYRPIVHTPKRCIVKDSQDSNKNDTTKTAKGEGLGKVFAQLCKDMTNFVLFRNLAFALFCTGTFFMNIGLVIFYQHTPSRAVSLGMEKEVAARLPAAIGIATLVARIIGSFIGDLRFVNRTLQCGICLGLGGVLLVFNTLTLSFTTIALMGAAIGFLSGTNMNPVLHSLFLSNFSNLNMISFVKSSFLSIHIVRMH